ncbi:hypothetical protein NHX12_001242 [Muraenolepis orangiensis]|uniref:Uncharacterized protein n=1 Tax=Muraenolepis orangiensis TaxID=630683 RepID=A0A9Q0D374_9TELE|nr:hypothetical protein NHX12_017360 [Muraenolepis orangiensis]KAJ3597725.1 hypothetical protein NHX12_001242 [Muraenolepis orangiensis]
MAMLKTYGDYLEASGWTTALTDAGVASSGTADSFLKVSHLTRTRHAHQAWSALALAKLQQDAFLDIVTEDEKTKEARREDMITKMINILRQGYHTQHGNYDICAGPQRTGFGLTGLCGVTEGPGPMVLLDHQNYA